MTENKKINDELFTFAHEDNAKLLDKTYNTTSYAKDVWNHFCKNKGAVIGAIIILVIIFFAIVGPYMNEHTYKSIITEHQSLVPKIPLLTVL